MEGRGTAWFMGARPCERDPQIAGPVRREGPPLRQAFVFFDPSVSLRTGLRQQSSLPPRPATVREIAPEHAFSVRFQVPGAATMVPDGLQRSFGGTTAIFPRTWAYHARVCLCSPRTIRSRIHNRGRSPHDVALRRAEIRDRPNARARMLPVMQPGPNS
jgi:hypothetical protein